MIGCLELFFFLFDWLKCFYLFESQWSMSGLKLKMLKAVIIIRPCYLWETCVVFFCQIREIPESPIHA